MEKKSKFSISIILPFLNEINSLKKTITILEKIKFKKEYIVIFSNKLTIKKNKLELQKLRKSFKNLRYFNQLKPYVGGAIDLGIKKSKLKFIAIMASDLETNPYELIKMIRICLKNPNSIISADRWLSEKGFSNYGVIKYLANFFFQKLIKFFFKYEILDFTFAYRIYPSKILKNLTLTEFRHGFALELLLKPIKMGHDIITIPATWRKRVEGTSSISIKSYLSYLNVLFKNI
tara:strand:- start:554 stop:1252 length:699 start_codon:yes stop_codon:yes gene_type:complete